MNEELMKKIRTSIYTDSIIDDKKDTLFMSFIKGYIHGSPELLNFISQYLWEWHGIDPEKNTWEQQVDHYAFERGVDWEKGFLDLRTSIIENAHISQDLFGDIVETTPQLQGKPVYKYEGPEELKPERIDNLQNSVQLKNGIVVKVGDIVQLSDKIGGDYKKTKFYDSSIRNPSFELFYPSEKDFRHISFYFKGDEKTAPFNFGRVRRLFSESVSEIVHIAIQGEEVFLYTDLFKIEVEKAIEAGEIKLLPKTDPSPILSDFSNLFNEISYSREYGGHSSLHKMSDVIQFINYWCFYHFSFLKKKWNKFGRTMSGGWFKRV